jgi:hypothetical protein
MPLQSTMIPDMGIMAASLGVNGIFIEVLVLARVLKQ